MEPLPVQTVVALVVTAGAGIWMTHLGLHKGMLARRLTGDRCATCGRRVRGHGCPNCRRRASY